MTLEEVKSILEEGAPAVLRFDIRHSTLWIAAGGEDLGAAATGSVGVDPPYVRVAGSTTLSGDPAQAEGEVRAMLALTRVLRRAQELLRLKGSDSRRRRRASEVA